MSENAGLVTVHPLQQIKLGSVGKPFPGKYVKINNPDSHGNGEVSSGAHCCICMLLLYVSKTQGKVFTKFLDFMEKFFRTVID